MGCDVPVQHLNLHTLRGSPVFADEQVERIMRRCVEAVLCARAILCPVWELMPNHVHLIVEEFADLSRARIMQFVKGDTSRAFCRAFPEMWEDMLGGRLWRPGYYAAHIATHRQYLTTVEYIGHTRANAGLPPSASFVPAGADP